ncbi:MAG: acyltransferase domain-containing protein [Anaerolineaceae bacterium]|nr:acyltransferase domain-containing protein [Anaerolineaceae bacterium]
MASRKQTNTEMKSRLSNTPIAIIGMSSLYPQADHLPAFWDNILNKVNSITEVPESRWSIEDYYDPDPKAEDKVYCKMGGFINDVPFNPMEFGLPPNILEVTDVSQLISLVVTKEALQDAGYLDSENSIRENTGVILGVVGMSLKLFTPLMARLQYPVWEKALRSSGIAEDDIAKIVEKMKLAYVRWTENAFPGTIGNVIAGRIANRFDLGGTNCVIDAACASSLAAIRMAIMELTDHRADMMVTGGIDTDNSIASYVCFSKTPAFSKSDRVRTFDENSDGMMVGEGLGMLVLKRLEDAERDGDRIYAVIKGIGSSSDGRFKSIYAPRSEGQAIAVRRAYKEAGFTPDTVGLIEAHGTGTMAGDPAEMAGLKLVYSEYDAARKQSIALGSIKSNIGHTKAAAGTAGMIKASLALHHKILPATINVEKPNPKFGLDETPLYINTETRPWIQAVNSNPRRAGVSAFGFGGTNFHVVLEEYQPEHTLAYRLQSKNNIVFLAADSPADLQAKCQQTAQALAGEQADHVFYELIQASREPEISASQARLGFVVQDKKDALSKLQLALDLFTKNPQQNAWSHPNGLSYRKSAADYNGKVVAMFSGQGSQYVNMGSELAMNFPVVREQFGKMDQLFVEDDDAPLSNVIYPIPVFDDQSRKQQDGNLRNTRHAQPAIGSMSMALYKILQNAGLAANFSLGHSFGELTALWAAGVFSDEDYQKAAKARGAAMAAPVDESFDAGSMLAVKGNTDELPSLLKDFPDVKIANFNSPLQVVLAGAKKDLNAVQAVLTEKGYSVIPLPVSAAFHTKLVAHAQKPFAAALKKLTFNAPSIPVYSNTTAKQYPTDPKKVQSTLEKHMLESVQFAQQVKQVYADGGRMFIEFGPKSVLTNLVRDILQDQMAEIEVIAINPNARADSDLQLRQAVVALKVAGLTFGDVDPYALLQEPKVLEKEVKGIINLTAGFYKTEKTIQAFEDAVSTIEPLQSILAAEAALQTVPVNTITTETETMTTEADWNDTFVPAEATLDRFQEQQAEALRLHDHYLQNEATYTEVFAQLTSQQLQLAQQPAETPEQNEQMTMILKSVNRNMDRFHQHQNETARLHEQYIDTHADFTRSFTQLLRSSNVVTVPGRSATKSQGNNSKGNGNGNGRGKSIEPRISASEGQVNQPAIMHSSPPVSVPQTLPVVEESPALSETISEKAIFDALLSIVAEKTGYPVEMIDPQMDMESDLGIDSIKRVEILGALQEAFPSLPEIPVDQLSTTKTLQEISDLMQRIAQASQPVGVIEQPVPKTVAPIEPQKNASAQPAIDLAALINSVIAEKTGYPIEMLEPEMDMESDLGIDSIKKVEIMGTLQETIPQAANIPAEQLAALRTMKDIQNMLGEFSSPIENKVEPVPAVVEPVKETQAVASIKLDKEVLLSSLINIVAEKTGYPAEMLEPEMNLEADLGIDSIKRVEIMGALQETFPDLPAVEAEEMAELSTLQKIQELLEKKASAGNKPGIQQASVTSILTSSLPVFQVKKQILPVPDRLLMTFPAKGVYLIVDQGLDIGETFSSDLQRFGWQTALIQLPDQMLDKKEKSNPVGKVQFVLDEISDAGFEKLINEIHQQFETICGAANFCVSHKVKSTQQFVNENSLQMNQFAFLLAKHMQSDLNIVREEYRNSFITVIQNDGCFGQHQPQNSDPLAGGLNGLVKTLSLEWSTVLCRTIDFAPGQSIAEISEKTVAEILDPNLGLREVGYQNGQRCCLIADRVIHGEQA